MGMAGIALKARIVTRRPINALMRAVVRAGDADCPIGQQCNLQTNVCEDRVVVPTMATAQLMSCVTSQRVNVSPDAMGMDCAAGEICDLNSGVANRNLRVAKPTNLNAVTDLHPAGLALRWMGF